MSTGAKDSGSTTSVQHFARLYFPKRVTAISATCTSRRGTSTATTYEYAYTAQDDTGEADVLLQLDEDIVHVRVVIRVLASAPRSRLVCVDHRNIPVAVRLVGVRETVLDRLDAHQVETQNLFHVHPCEQQANARRLRPRCLETVTWGLLCN